MKFFITQAEYDGLTPEQQNEYSQNTSSETQSYGAFVQTNMGLPSGFSVENVQGLKSGLAAERETVKKLNSQVKKWESLENYDVDDIVSTMSKRDEIMNHNGDAEFEEKVKHKTDAMAKKHQQELEAVSKRAEIAEQTIRETKITSAGVAALQEAGGNITLLMPHLEKRCRMVNKDGQYLVEVLDDQGRVAVGDSQGNPMNLSQLVDEFKNDDRFAGAFDSTAGSGTEKGNTTRIPHKSPKATSPNVISASNQSALNGSIEDIAKGKVRVTSD